MVTIDTERLISEKQNNKASAEGARPLKGINAIERYCHIYEAIPGRVLSFWSHQQGLPRAKKSPNSIIIASPQNICIYYINERYFALHYPKRSESIRVLGTNKRSVMMIGVKVNSKSQLVEDREGKSALYGVICCCDDRLLSRAVICGHRV